jgi:hypothetical protein
MALQTFAGGLGTSPSAASPSPERQAQVPVADLSLRCILKDWAWKAHCHQNTCEFGTMALISVRPVS